MHLADRSAREGFGVEARKQPFERRRELFFDDLSDGVGRRARRRIPELGERALITLALSLGDEAVDVTLAARPRRVPSTSAA
jgi:hypothetical protein